MARSSIVYQILLPVRLRCSLLSQARGSIHIPSTANSWTIAIPSLFGCRLLLNIRKQYSAPRSPEDVEMAFA